LRRFFPLCKAEDAVGLAPYKDDNEAQRKKDRKDGMIFKSVSYKVQSKGDGKYVHIENRAGRPE